MVLIIFLSNFIMLPVLEFMILFIDEVEREDNKMKRAYNP